MLLMCCTCVGSSPNEVSGLKNPCRAQFISQWRHLPSTYTNVLLASSSQALG